MCSKNYGKVGTTHNDYVPTSKISGNLIRGTHYYQIGKTVRIPWSMELLASLSTINFTDSERSPARSGKYQKSINLDY
jgi:hypothetical protein